MALVEVEPSGEYELTSLIRNGSARDPTLTEHTEVRNYLESLGFYGLWRRAKRGNVKVVANERGNVAQSIKLEVVKMGMKTFRVSAQVIDEATGKVDSTLSVEQNGQNSLGVCDLQDTLLSTYGAALSAKGREFAQAKADKPQTPA